MSEPRWITKRAIHAMHEELLARFGGLSGIRDEGMLESALERPRQRFHYAKPSVFELAAEYALGVIKNHPFLDGNKRTGFLAAYLFLIANGEHFGGTEESVVLHTLGLAAGEIGVAEYAAWLKRACMQK